MGDPARAPDHTSGAVGVAIEGRPIIHGHVRPKAAQSGLSHPIFPGKITLSGKIGQPDVRI